MESPATAVPVVCALIEREGTLLIAQRPAHKHLPLAWEFPGGKVEPGESAETAIRREIHEELGCAIELHRALPRRLHQYPAVTIEMIPFVARIASDSPEPEPTEHIAVKWVPPSLLESFNLAPADLPVLRDYLSKAGLRLARKPGVEHE